MSFEILVPIDREVDWVAVDGLTLPREFLKTTGYLPGQSYVVQSWALPSGVGEPSSVTIVFKPRPAARQPFRLLP